MWASPTRTERLEAPARAAARAVEGHRAQVVQAKPDLLVLGPDAEALARLLSRAEEADEIVDVVDRSRLGIELSAHTDLRRAE